MKKLIISMVLTVAAAAPRLMAVETDVQTVDGYGPYQTGVGGEFTLQGLDPTMDAIINAYGAGAKNQYNVSGATPNFQTFCVEGREYIYANTKVSVVFNNQSVYTDVALTKGAAWLYSQFAQGTLYGYNYANGTISGVHSGLNYGDGSRAGSASSSAQLLQNAIWALMGGQEGQTYDGSNPFEAAAASQFGGWANADSAAATGLDGVYVLNLWAAGSPGVGTGYQDQLVYVAQGLTIPNVVPDGGTTVLLLGMALTGLGFVARRVRR